MDPVAIDCAAIGDDEPDESIWQSSVGYSPLFDLLLQQQDDDDDNDDQQNGAVMMAVGPHDHEEHGGGVFFADMTAFGLVVPSCADDDEDDDDTEKRRIEQQEQMETTTADFRSLAEQALLALDHEYQSTVQQSKGSAAGGAEQATLDFDNGNNDDPLPPIHFPTEVYGHDYFVVTFPDDETLGEPVVAPLVPDIEMDADAVRRAVAAIQLKDPKLDTNLAQWQAFQQTILAARVPRLHSILSRDVLDVFRRPNSTSLDSVEFAASSSNANKEQESARLTRSATIAEALRRLDILRFNMPLVIDVIGCDHVECQDANRIRQVFGPLATWLVSSSGSSSSRVVAEAPSTLLLNLIGPNLPATTSRQVELLLFKKGDSRARVTCHSMTYDEFLQQEGNTNHVPNLVISFHAGIWGYREWTSTLCLIAARGKRQQEQEQASLSSGVPFVVTSYTLQEAEGDAEAIQQCLDDNGTAAVSATAGTSKYLLWSPEPNAFGSLIERETATAPPGHRYRENAAWQAWRL